MLKSTNGVELFTQNYIVENAKASLLLIHGLGEYSGRYTHVVNAFNAAGVNVYTFDLRGHGYSHGERAFITDLDEYQEDVEGVYSRIPKDLPCFILGHSMGGLIAVHFLLSSKQNNVQGVILSGAALEVGADISPLTQKIVRLLAKISPKIKTVKLDPKKISRDPATVKAYQTDPLIYRDGGKTGLAVALLDGIQQQQAKFKLFTYPVLVMHGQNDQITNPDGSKKLYEEAASTDKTLKIWDGAFHEIFNEINKSEVIDYTVSWLDQRV